MAPLRTERAVIPAHGGERRRLRAGLIALILGLGTLSFNAMARELTICVPQNPMPPISYPDRDSVIQSNIRAAIAQMGDSVRFVGVPWLRCRMGVKSGEYVGAMPMTAAAENLAQYALPSIAGKVDASKAVAELRIRILRRMGSDLDWNGNQFSRPVATVMVLPGQIVAIDKIRSLELKMDMSTANPDSILRKLTVGRSEVAAIQEGYAEMMTSSPEFQGKLEILPIPLVSKPAYLGFNLQFWQADPGYAEAIWSRAGMLRKLTVPDGPVVASHSPRR